jgi:hypothetical protein
MRTKTLYHILLFTFFAGILLKYFATDSKSSAILFVRLSQISGSILFFLQAREIQVVEKTFFRNQKYQKLVIILLSIFLGTILHFIYFGEISLSIGYSLAGAGVSLTMIRSIKYHKQTGYLLGGVTIIFSYLMLSNVAARFWGKGSENHVSIFILFFTIIYFLAQQLNNRNPNPVQALLALTISLFAQGRGGVISAGILFLGIIAIRYTQKLTSFMIALVLTTLVYFLFIDRIQYLLNPIFLAIFDRPLLDDPRMILNNTYIENLNWAQLIFGAKAFGSEFSMNMLGITAHNSFLSIHASYGIFALLIFGVLGLSIISNWNRNNYLVVFLIAILFRSFSDSVLLTSGIELTTILIFIVILTDYKSKEAKYRELK